MADYLIDPRFRDARNIIGACLGMALGMAVVAHALPLAETGAAPGISFVSGGNGEAAAADLQRAAAHYSLEVDFLPRQDGGASALPGNPVTIRDRNGKAVVAAVAQGPILLAVLPPGSYTVEASDGERTVRGEVNIRRSGHERLVLAL